MTFHVYENKAGSGHRTKIHRSECPYCNHGQGIHGTEVRNHDAWHGPFDRFNDADNEARRRCARVETCKSCRPSP